MGHNQVIIIESPTFIHVKNMCIVFEQQKKVIARVLPEDIDCLILHYTTTITASALAILAQNRATVTLLDEHQLPFAHWQPPKANHQHKKRFLNLLKISKSSLGEKLWQRIIKSKIKTQAEVLNLSGCNGVKRLKKLSEEVKPNDYSNLEAQAAKIYWKSLLGRTFRREKKGSNLPLNQHLNFGYSVIRSLLGKWLSGHGISLEWGLHHQNQGNPMCLVDDMIEPFRFVVDKALTSNIDLYKKQISSTSKKILLTAIYEPISFNGCQMRLSSAINSSCESLARVLDKPSKASAKWLDLPYI